MKVREETVMALFDLANCKLIHRFANCPKLQELLLAGILTPGLHWLCIFCLMHLYPIQTCSSQDGLMFVLHVLNEVL